MKKTKLIIWLSLLLVMLSACKTSNSIDYANLLKGTWINTMVDEKNVLTDDTFVMEFKADKTEMYAIGFQIDENNKSWIENSSYTYSVKGNEISITGTDAFENSMQMEFKIISLDNDKLIFSVSNFLVNGEEIPDNKIYTCNKVTKDYKDEFVGIWYGHNTIDENSYFYWEYFDDGSFDFYYQDDNENWVKKDSNDGQYFLYGSFMVSNYSNDLLTGKQGRTFECWNFTIDEDKMQWTGLRENNIMVTFDMKKVLAAPEY